MASDRRRTWEDRHRLEAAAGAPSPFVIQALDALEVRRSGTQTRSQPASSGSTSGAKRALDVACGRGRHALLLAQRGYDVDAVDFAVPALTTLRRTATEHGLAIDCVAADVTAWPIPPARYALVVVVNFLERSLFASLREAVLPGGALLYETHRQSDDIAATVRPEFLLAPGELDELCRGWDVVLRAEGSTMHRGASTARAGILARRPAPPH